MSVDNGIRSPLVCARATATQRARPESLIYRTGLGTGIFGLRVPF
jgi:hypothetical protein